MLISKKHLKLDSLTQTACILETNSPFKKCKAAKPFFNMCGFTLGYVMIQLILSQG